MAISKCGKCDKTTFETKVVKMVDGKTEVTMVQCATCGNVVGVLDPKSLMNVGNAILREVQSLQRR
jgi:hypothetical protein